MRSRLRAVVATVAIMAVVVALLALLGMEQIPLPVRMYYVPSRSMEPTLSVGDLVIAVPVSPREVSCGPQGDVIIYRRPDGSRIIHRAIACVEVGGRRFFLTKGDNNLFYDQNPLDPSTWLPEELVIAKLALRIPLVGYIPMLFERLRLFLLPVLLALIAYFVYSSLSPSRSNERRHV
ncbi:MAG: signal peptidase I [Candidatus Nezhaarchaeota archaeon]|nr:signal peptidase I [Candidatus Nezhaarchaeota archaeon]